MKKKHLLFLVLFMQALIFRSHAAKITVTNNADNVVGGLRYVIDNAGSGDTIVFAQSLVGATISLSSNIIVIDKDLTILGLGEDKLTVTNNLTTTLFKIEFSANVFIRGIKIVSCGDYTQTLQNDVSGAIYNEGNLILKELTFYDNQAGAIHNKGTIFLERVLFYANYAQGDRYPERASGLSNTGTATIKECRFDENGSDGSINVNPSGIRNSGTMNLENTSVTNGWASSTYASEVGAITNTGTLNLRNCTISKNFLSSSKFVGAGGIYNTGTLNVEYCTIAYNTFSSNSTYLGIFAGQEGYYSWYKGSGIYNIGNLTLKGTLIAQNGINDLYFRFRGTLPPIEVGVDGYSATLVNDLGYNFLGVNDGLYLNTTTNILGTSLEHLNPRLGPLQNNGGFTLTHALPEGSYCIDAGGSSSTVLSDQLGESRRIPDIGAHEYQGGQLSLSIDYAYSSVYAPGSITLKSLVSYRKPFIFVSHVPGYRKLKLGYDTIGLYHANKNVLAGGNDVLEITLRSYNEDVEWDKIQIRPNGSVVNPLSMKDYITGPMSSYYNTIRIPLADFDPSIDFSHLILLEFPYSNNAGYFKLGIEKILFTGGTTPFLWFGESKFDNIFDGGGVGGQLLASLFPTVTVNDIQKVEYFNGNIKIGEAVSTPFLFNWENVESGIHTVNAIAHIKEGMKYVAPPVAIRVFPAIQRESNLLQSEYLSEEFVYPNPTTDIITIKSLNSRAQVVIRDINGAIQYQEQYSNIQNGQADISYLPAGLYFLKLEDEESPSGKVIKLIKQ